jgi:protein AbiQ
MEEQKIFDFQILKLTEEFYNNYPQKEYPELLKKEKRGYNCLLIQTHYDYFVCIPYRSEIHHKYAFKFQNTKRSKKHNSGLDYSKIVIIKNHDFISSESAMIDRDEYMKTKRFISKIVKESLLYIDEYVSHMNNKIILSKKDFNRKYGMSTLKYFHKELSIQSEQ